MKMVDPKSLQRRLLELVHYDTLTGTFIATASVGNVRRGDRRGNADAAGYMRFMVDGRQYLSHVLAWVYTFGVFPCGELDHINGMKCDNRISNLRDVNASVNAHNKPVGATAGVSQHRRKFKARISKNGRRVTLGIFATELEAICAYREAKTRLNWGQRVALIPIDAAGGGGEAA